MGCVALLASFSRIRHVDIQAMSDEVKIVRDINGFWIQIGKDIYFAMLTPYKQIPVCIMGAEEVK